MTQLLLIRHAINDYVKTHRLAGWTPGVHLNADGRAQAAALGLRLAGVHIHAIYASPLERTVETAEAIIQHHPELKLNLLEDVGEVRYGDWTGEEIRKLVMRKMWRVVQMNPSRAVFPNGEAMHDVQVRAVNALERLVRNHPRQTVAVVSHSDVIKMMLAHYMGMHLDLFQRLEVSPASLTIIELSSGRPTIVQVNETSYLPKLEKRTDQASEDAYAAKKAVRSITIDAVGEPGARTFYLQARHQSGSLVSLVLEKTQALTFADQVDELAKTQSLAAGPADGSASETAAGTAEVPALVNPQETLFRVGKFGLQYNADSKLIDVEITELRGVDQGEPSVLHLWASGAQLSAAADHARRVARSGSAATD